MTVAGRRLNSPLVAQVEMEDEFLTRVTEICADPASQQSEKQVGGLEMSWNTEGGRLACRWVDSPEGEKRNYHGPGSGLEGPRW